MTFLPPKGVLGLPGLLFLCLQLSTPAQDIPRDDLLVQATAMLEEDHYARAESLLREFLLHQPAHVEGSFLLGVALAKQEKWEAAGQQLKRTIELDPSLASAYVELAGVRHQQGANREAMRLLRRVISLDRENRYAKYFLASLSYLEGRQLEALYHWNEVAEPHIRHINYRMSAATKPELIARLFRLNQGEVLRRQQLMDIDWIQERLRLRTNFHWLLQPVASDDQWDLEISVSRPNALASWYQFLLANAPRVAFNREVSAQYENDRGQGFGGGVRWNRFRKQVMATASFPFLFSASDVLLLGGDAREEVWQHVDSETDFTLQSQTVSGSYEHAFPARRSLTFHARYRHQDFRYHQGTPRSESPLVVALGLEWNQRFSLNPQDNRRLHWATRIDQISLLGDARQGTYKLGTRVGFDWSLRETSQTGLAVSLQAGISDETLPLEDYFSLGVGPDHPLPLRAHPTLRDGRKGNNPLGRGFALANVELDHRLFRWRFLEVKGFTFSDIAVVRQAPFGPPGREWFHDVGGGLRLGFFGQDLLQLVLGWDLKTRSFNHWTGLPGGELRAPQ